MSMSTICSALCSACQWLFKQVTHVQVSRKELDKVRSCKSNLNKMLARVVELKQVHLRHASVLPCFHAGPVGAELTCLLSVSCHDQSAVPLAVL